MAHVMDYWKEVAAAGGMLRLGNFNDYTRCAKYYLIVDPHQPSEYAGYFVHGLGDNPVKTPVGYACHREGASWNVPKNFYDQYKKLFELVDKFSKEFPNTFQAIQPQRR
jgi:hypothetical protein